MVGGSACHVSWNQRLSGMCCRLASDMSRDESQQASLLCGGERVCICAFTPAAAGGGDAPTSFVHGALHAPGGFVHRGFVGAKLALRCGDPRLRGPG